MLLEIMINSTPIEPFLSSCTTAGFSIRAQFHEVSTYTERAQHELVAGSIISASRWISQL
jgi:hypothetical protein